MSTKRPATETMKISDVRGQLNKIVSRVSSKESRIVVEKSGIPVAGIVSAEDMERLARLDEEDREAWSIVDEMRAAFKDVPPEELEREAELAIAEVRAELRAERERAAS